MSRRPTRAASKAQETAFADRIGGRVTPNSGATWHTKGDVQDENFLYELKTHMTRKNSHSIPKSELEKIKKERFEAQKSMAAYVFDYGTQKTNDMYVVLSIDDFETLYNHYKNTMEEE